MPKRKEKSRKNKRKYENKRIEKRYILEAKGMKPKSRAKA